MQIVVIGAKAILALVGAIQVVRGGDWFLVALPICVCAIGLASLIAGDAGKGRRVFALPVLLVGAIAVVLGVIAVATSEASINIFMVFAVLGTVLAVVGGCMQVRRAAAVRREQPGSVSA